MSYWQTDIGFPIDFTDLLGGVLPEGSTLFSLKKAQLNDMGKAFLNFKTSPKIGIGSGLCVETILLFLQNEIILIFTITSETGLLLFTFSLLS